jgi:putative cell wall-binding protein
MKFISIAKAIPVQGGNRQLYDDDKLTVTTRRNGKNRCQLCIKVGIDVMRKWRWVIGDKVTVEVGRNENNELVVRIERTNSKGYSLTGNSKSKDKIAAAEIKYNNEIHMRLFEKIVGKQFTPFEHEGKVAIICSEE